jgi:uncharacterized protein YndB with AHSA1/START domain/predicted pyridoxine 5'-phosphate oxidase superfamily flavin-nucleotide-binding protein
MKLPDQAITTARSKVSVALVRRLNASADLVFKACTDPKWLARWLTPGAGTIHSVTVDFRVGGSFRLDGMDPDGSPYEVTGCYLEITPGKRIVATWNYDGAVAELGGPVSEIQFDLRSLGQDVCELTLTHAEMADNGKAERYRTVWSICLDRLAWSTDPNPAEPIFHTPIGAIADIYGERHRVLQDAFETRRLANRLRKVSVTSTLTADHQLLIGSCDMAFISTVDHRGFPTCSYKGGAPGFVLVEDERTLMLPSYDGNGMYLTAGNIRANPKIGLLFINFEKPHRVRIHGSATLISDEVSLRAFPGAELLIAVRVNEAFINCPRYVHRYQRVASSKFVPTGERASEVAPWKNLDFIRDAISPRDQALLDESGAEPITLEEYRDRVSKDDL